MRIAHGGKGLRPTGTVVPTPPSAPTLANLTAANMTFAKGTSRSEPILGATPGSTITATGLPSGITIDNVNRLFVYDGAGAGGAGSITPSEALTGATNTPHTSPAISYTINAAPAFTANPSISGSPNVGNTLTGSDGTITGYPVPTVMARRFKSSGALVASTSTYALVSGDLGNTMTFEVDVSNGIGGTVTGVSAGVGPVAEPGLATPTVTNVSSTGTAPVVLSLTDGDYVAGLYLQWEFTGSLTPSKNGDGSYATTTQSGVTFIDGDSWSRLDLALGYNDPSGAFAFHCRVVRENETGATTISYVDAAGNTITFLADVSGWSTDYTDTIGGSVAVLNSTTGINKSRYLNVASPFLQFIHTTNDGGYAKARSTVPAANSKWHAEFRLDCNNNTGGTVIFGICDVGTSGVADSDFNTGTGSTFKVPGDSGVAGLTLRTSIGNTGLEWHANGTSGSYFPSSFTFAQNDIVEIEGDESTHTYKFYIWDDSAGAMWNGGAAVGTITLSSGIPGTTYAFGGGQKGDGTTTSGHSDAGTFNFGGSPFITTPTAGYSDFG